MSIHPYGLAISDTEIVVLRPVNSTTARQIEKIYDILMQVFEITKKEEIPTAAAANKAAEKRVAMMSKLKQTWIGPQEATYPRGRKGGGVC